METPTLSAAAVSDPQIESLATEVAGMGRLYMNTSPEYPMKRLLAAGSGDIYQICKVFRDEERGRWHNPEFTLIEWYRTGFSLGQLMDEVEALVRLLLAERAGVRPAERLSYREVFVRELRLDPFTALPTELARCAAAAGFGSAAGAGRDELLELLMGTVIGPRLGAGGLTFIHGYPASQAALARLDPQDPRAAERFELYGGGIELANGFHELAAVSEQRARFEADNAERRRRGLAVHALDERLLAALASGLPDCAGVALGFDRTVMLATGAERIDEVLAFPTARA